METFSTTLREKAMAQYLPVLWSVMPLGTFMEQHTRVEIQRLIVMGVAAWFFNSRDTKKHSKVLRA
jgi:hypothetical protein